MAALGARGCRAAVGATIGAAWVAHCTRRPREEPWRIRDTVILPCSREDAFDLLGDVRNLDSLTPPWFVVNILDASAYLSLIDAGEHVPTPTFIKYDMVLYMVPFPWVSEITAFDRPSEVSYREQRGPYGYYWHQHKFVTRAGGAEVEDLVDFEVLPPTLLWLAPLWLRHVANAVALDRLRAIFAHRDQKLIQRFGGGKILDSGARVDRQ